MTQSSSTAPRFRVSGEGPLLVYISGLDGTGELFFRQSPSLSKSHRVVTFRSRDQEHFSYDDLTEDVAEIIRHLGESKATIVGESFGGTVALKFALRHPDMIDRLVVVNSFPKFRGRLRIRVLIVVTAILPFSWMRPLRVFANLLGLYVDGIDRQSRIQFFRAAGTVQRPAYLQRLRLISEFDVLESLGQIEVPTLLIASTNDIVVPSLKEARVMSQRIPGARMIIVRGAGHACLMGDRVDLAGILDEWRRLESGHAFPDNAVWFRS